MNGRVSNVVSSKKFGFIAGENGQEYFFHITDLVDDCWDELDSTFLKLGKGRIKVLFDPIKTPKGPRANNVSVIE